MSDLNTSILVNKQVPEFVREEHPKFISFLEAYYEFLNNTTYGKSKDLRNISDVDETLEEFETQFFNTFLPYVNRDTALSKEKLFKNILPLYLSKGSEKSFQLLFRMLFGEEVTLTYPKNQILRASDGKWRSDSVLRVEVLVESNYVSDGIKTIYFLPYIIDSSQVKVYVNEVLTTNYLFKKEYQKIELNFTPSLNDKIKVVYSSFDISILRNRKITGISSGASAIVENTGKRNISGLSFFQLFINLKNLLGKFQNGEKVESDVIVNDTELVPLTFQTYSDLREIRIIEPGSNYQIGDPVIIRGESQSPAYAIVSDVTSGKIEDIIVSLGGSGFKVGNNISANGYIEAFFSAQVLTVDDSGANSINSISFNTDVIEDYLSVTLSDLDYGFPANTDADFSAVISTAFTSNTVNNLGPITSIIVLETEISSTETPQFIIQTSNITSNISVTDLRAVGSINIVSGGIDYEVGDELVFLDLSFSGSGASGYVSDVSANGEIETVRLTSGGLLYDQNSFPTITVNSANGSGANLVVQSLLGSGAKLDSIIGDGISGKILSIRILDSGSGYFVVPGVDLSFSGDGNAIAEANIRNSFVNLSGRWTTSDSILSSDETRLQGLDYYIDYSYIINSSVEFDRYKSLLKNLIHPAGYKNFALYKIADNITVNSKCEVISTENLTLSGSVNVANSSVIVLGTNTNFLIAQTNNIINIGTVISVNNQVRNVVSIADETHFNVNTAFTMTSNNDFIKILT
jgi:hypothetical protein